MAITVVAGIRRVLDLLATRYVRRALQSAPGVHGDLYRVHVGLAPPGIRLRALQIASDDRGLRAVLSCERAEFRLRPLALLRGRLVGRLDIDRAVATLIRAENERPASKEGAEEPSPQQAAGESSLTAINPQHILRRLPAFAVDRVRVRKAGILYREPAAGGKLRIHDVNLTVSGVATRSELTQGRPLHVTGSGRIGRHGRFNLSVDADPYASRLRFGGRAELHGFHLRELESLIAPRTDLRIPEGTFDVFIVFRCEAGKLHGGVKPVLKDVKIEAGDHSWLDRTKAWLADKTINVTSGEVEGHKAVATIIPILGTLDSPDIQLVPAILGVLRNAFVIGLREGFDNLPPEVAASRKGFFKQAKEALSRSAGSPKAQPTKP